MMPDQKVILPSETIMPEFLARSVMRAKQHRVSTLRQLQAISKVVADVTNGTFQGLSDFDPPSGFKWEPIAHDKKRLLATRGDEQIATVRAKDGPDNVYVESERVVPSAFAPTQGINVCVAGLGQ